MGIRPGFSCSMQSDYLRARRLTRLAAIAEFSLVSGVSE